VWSRSRTHWRRCSVPATESQSVTDLIAALDGHAPDRVTPLLVLADAMADAEDPREAGVRTLAAIGYRTSYYRGLRLPWTWWRHVGSDANDNLINYHDSWHPWWDQMTGDCSYGAGNAKEHTQQRGDSWHRTHRN
jgi:hypothetical protein